MPKQIQTFSNNEQSNFSQQEDFAGSAPPAANPSRIQQSSDCKKYRNSLSVSWTEYQTKLALINSTLAACEGAADRAWGECIETVSEDGQGKGYTFPPHPSDPQGQTLSPARSYSECTEQRDTYKNRCRQIADAAKKEAELEYIEKVKQAKKWWPLCFGLSGSIPKPK